MQEKAIPTIFIELFTKLFGSKANLAMSLYMFSRSEPGKRLFAEIGIAFETAEGRQLLDEIIGVIKSETPQA
jgi:hypothetical protein